METLQEKRTAATREHILNAAFERLVEHPDEPFSHEVVAKAAGVGARTVYRYFPAQADFYEALWLRLRKESGTVFPRAEAEIVPSLGESYRAFDENERLVRAMLESPAGARVRARGAEEGRACFEQSLKDLLKGRSASERRQIRAVFQGLHSGMFWQMLKDRGELSGTEAIAAVSWAAGVLLDALRREQRGIVARKKEK
ncbi:MAG: TetR/AcrR family transcriptional regulator [Bryobacteraceae bacterium]